MNRNPIRHHWELDVYKLIHRRTITVVGAHAGSLDTFDPQPLGRSRMEVLAEMLGWIARGKLSVRPLLTHTATPEKEEQLKRKERIR